MNDKFYYRQGTVVCLADSQPWKKQGSKGLADGGCARQGHLREEHRSLAMTTDMLRGPEGRFLKEKLKFKQSLR